MTRRQRSELRDLLVAATAAAGRHPDPRLAGLVERAPLEALPPAAALHRVSGLVRRCLEGATGLPADVAASLVMVERDAAEFHLHTIGALARIAAAFESADVAFVVMKGPVVASTLYPSPTDRRYNDLDLLVERRQFGTAMQILEDFGYRHVIRDWRRAERDLAGQVELVSPVLRIDLHWHLHYSHGDRRPFALSPDEMLARSRRLLVSGVVVPTFDAVDTALTLAFHAARSDGHRLMWLKDIERATSVIDDHDELVRRCHRYRCAPPVGLMLERSRALLRAELPSEVVTSLVPAPMLAADRASRAVVDPIQFHERDTLTRLVTRSARSSAWATVADVPTRLRRRALERRRRQPWNETDDETEKASFVRAVAAAGDGAVTAASAITDRG